MINPYLDQTIADQFQAEADLSEFDPLDVALLTSVANKKKNDIGINTLKQKAAFGIDPRQAATNLIGEKRQKEQELAKQQAETDEYENIFASIGDATSEAMGYGGLNDAFSPPRPTPPAGWNPYEGAIVDNWGSGASPESIAFPNGAADLGYTNPDAVSFANKFGTVADTRGNLGYPQAPTQTTPGSYTAGLNTQLGTEMQGLYGIKREYANDEGYNQAMAAVREALGKAPAIPTMQKPELKKEDQALILLAGLFGGMDKIPQAMQGALAGATQRAQIANQQAQNTFEQQQGLYNQQLRGLQSQAELEAQKRQQAQTALDRQYEQATRASQGRIAKLQTQIQNAPLEEEKLAQRKTESVQKQESIDANARLKAWQQNKSMLDQDLKTYRDILEMKIKTGKITKQDYEGLLGRKNGLIEKYQKLGMGDIGSLFYVPRIGEVPQTIEEKMRAMKTAYDYGMRTGKSIAQEIGGSLFGDTDTSPFATEASEKLDKLTTAYNTEAKKVQPFISKYNKAIEALQQANIAYKNSQVVKGTSIVGEDTKLTAKLKTQFEEAYNKVQSMQKQYRQLMGPKSSFTRAKMAMESEYKKLGLPLNQSPVSKTPGKNTSQNTFETSLGTLTFKPESYNA